MIFLLGGHDLEMETIKNILIEKKCVFYDANLTWSDAKLSRYVDVLHKYDCCSQTIYGIELTEDILVPGNYCRIDHHNDFSNRKSSLEQVADVLQLKLNRWQQLVAINDSRYIHGLVAFGASEKEIRLIRSADRKAQGVSAEEERQADLSIQSMEYIEGLKIVYTKNIHFSPIVDRLYPIDQLLVYSDCELTFYGNQVNKLINNFAEEIKCGKAYYGGGQSGFFGISKGFFSKSKIKHYKQQIVNVLINEI